jgi:hypothetical protein
MPPTPLQSPPISRAVLPAIPSALACLLTATSAVGAPDLPEGQFVGRKIATLEAAELHRAAHAYKTLQCVSRDDMPAPYKAKKRRRHQELDMIRAFAY